jgi:Tol biopolymer transport system component
MQPRGRCALPHPRRSTTFRRVNRPPSAPRSRRIAGGPCRAAAAVLAGLALLLAAPSAAASDPDLEWRTFETPHFRINFPDYLERIAGRIARALERAHRILVPLLDHEPEGLTEVVVTDDTDSSNGSATALPMNVLRFFAIPPMELSTLQEYDDWLNMLVIHEYTHTLFLDNIGGLATVVNALLGKVWAPNHMAPRFVIEGYSVYQESTRTTGGRIDSTLWDMYLRTAVAEDSLLRLDQVTHGALTWPHGDIAYMYGGYFIDFIARTYGEEVLGPMATDYGSDWLPFGISRALDRATGADAVELYDAFKADLEQRFGAQAAAVREEGLVEGTRLVTDAETVRAPRFSPDGKRIGYYAYDGYDQPSLYAVDVASGERERLLVMTGSGAMSWAPDGKSFVYHRAEVYRGMYGFYDLFTRTAAGDDVQLTRGLRAREPALNPSGDRIVCVFSAAAGSYLGTLSPDGSGLEIILSGDEEVQLYTPRWSPDGKTIAFAAWIPGRNREIFLLDVETKALTRLTDDEAYDSTPVFSPDGKTLFFSSDRTGIANIYAMDPATGRTRRVTNVIGGAFHPDVSPDGKTLAFVGFVAKGYDLRTLALDPEAWVEVEASTPTAIERLEPDDDEPDDPTPGVPRSRPYDPWQTAAPRSWWIQYANGGTQPVLTFSALGNDVADFHALSGSLDVGLYDGQIGYAVGYAYHGWYPTLSVGHWYGTQPRKDLMVDAQESPWTQRAYGARAEVSVPFSHGRWGQWYSASYRFEYTEPNGGRFDFPLDPNQQAPQFPDTGILSGVSLSWYFSTVRGATYPAGSNYGFAFGTDVSLSDPAFGSDYEVLEWHAGITGYFQTPWVRSHSIAGRLAGALGRANYRSRGIFFLGGFPEQDFLQGIFYGQSMGSAPLRGYDPWSIYGSRYVQANVEYRLPIVDVDAGLWTIPGFLRRITATAFCDIGAASWGEMTWDDVKVGAGAELFIEGSIGWYLEWSLRIGYGYGFMDPGGHDFYVVMGSPF